MYLQWKYQIAYIENSGFGKGGVFCFMWCLKLCLHLAELDLEIKKKDKWKESLRLIIGIYMLYKCCREKNPDDRYLAPQAAPATVLLITYPHPAECTSAPWTGVLKEESKYWIVDLFCCSSPQIDSCRFKGWLPCSANPSRLEVQLNPTETPSFCTLLPPGHWLSFELLGTDQRSMCRCWKTEYIYLEHKCLLKIYFLFF